MKNLRGITKWENMQKIPLVKRNWNQKNFWKKLNTAKCFFVQVWKCLFIKMTFWISVVAQKMVSDSHNTIIFTHSHTSTPIFSKIRTSFSSISHSKGLRNPWYWYLLKLRGKQLKEMNRIPPVFKYLERKKLEKKLQNLVKGRIIKFRWALAEKIEKKIDKEYRTFNNF